MMKQESNLWMMASYPRAYVYEKSPRTQFRG